MSQDRLPPIAPDAFNEAQKQAAAEFAEGRGYAVRGPFAVMMRSPEVMLRAKAMGDYLRFRSVLPPALNEFAILITARQWTQHYEWQAHVPHARKAGLKDEIIAAVAEGRRPAAMSAEEAAIYEFSTELHVNKGVSDATFAKVQAAFGEQGVIDLVGVNGYYTFNAMMMNVARTPIPSGAEGLKPYPL